ncbi:MAG TPA: FAD-dependent oxidoreductase [Thermodesulfobacteriota bacterium]|nr:FAD-dependent oxidoreductase [Thermodesulfobacteriota bacterium]
MEEIKRITLTIDGKEISTEPGKTVLTVARENGIEIPTLCFDPRLPPYGSCLLCVVEIEGIAKLVLSCTTEVRDKMVVRTNNERIFKARKEVLDMLLSNHFADCRGPCYEECPAHVDVQGYLALAKDGKYKAALELIRQTNPLPLVCGRVCVRKCEAACRRQEVDSSVAINFIKRYVSDLEYDNLDKPIVAKRNGRKVAIVGGGPGGLTCAYFLARNGYQVKIFEQHPKLGGMLRWGIPDYRLPQHALDKEIQYVLDHGIEAQTNVRLGRDFSLDDLKNQGYDAIFLALGAQLAKGMQIKNEQTEGVVGGVTFLERVKKEGAPNLKGHVVVVGGGNTAVDAARTALRCNASKVSILYRRTRAEMPADEVEIEDALAEGVEIKYLVAPLEVISENGTVKSLRVQEMRLGEPDASGRRRPVPIEGGEYEVLCNTIIAAIGQDSDLTGIKGNKLGDIDSTKWGTIVADDATLMTNQAGVFAGGDVVTGPAAAIDAIGAGRRAAMVIDRYIQTGQVIPPRQDFRSSRTKLGDIPAAFFETFEKVSRSIMQQTDAESRVGSFAEVDQGITPEAVGTETGRCLQCGCADIYTCELKKWAGEYTVDQGKFKGKVKKYKVDNRHPYVLLDPNKCILCGKCVRTCESLLGVSALGFINRGYDMVVRPSMEKPLQETTCISCGNCIESCPTGAVSYNVPWERLWRRSEIARLESVCNYCGTGCTVVFNKDDEKFWNITAKEESPYVKGELCVRGRFGHRHILTQNRLVEPKVLEGTVQKTTNLEYAIEAAAKGLQDVYKKHGGSALAFLVSPKATNEEVFMVQKIAREVFNSNNVASLYDITLGDDSAMLFNAFGVTASTVTRQQVEGADVIVLLNSNVTEENPVLSFTLKRAVRKGAALISISAMEVEMNNVASLWVHTRRGTNTALLNAAISEILKAGRYDEAQINRLTENFGAFKEQKFISLAEAEDTTGVDKADIQRFAEMISEPGKKVVFIYNRSSVVEKSEGDLQAIANIQLLTGNIGKDNAGILLTGDHSNYQGHKDLFATPHAPRENRRLGDPQGSRTYAELKEALLGGTIKGMLIFGEDFAISKEHEDILSAAEFVAVVDMFENETTGFAHVAIPGTAYAETEGCVTSQDRKVQAFTRIFEPPAGKTALEILAGLYAKVSGKTAPSIADVRSDIAGINPLYRKIVDIGEHGSFSWNETEAGGELLFATGFLTPSGKAAFTLGGDQAQKPFRRQTFCFSSIDKVYRSSRYVLFAQ